MGFFIQRYITIFLAFSFLSSIGQVVIEGKLVNEEEKTPIAFANIGILDTPVGTISNQDGTFEISIPERYLKDTLLFSALGFEKKSFQVKNLAEKKIAIIYLREQTTLLRNVTVKSTRLRPARTYDVGQRNYNTGSIYVDSVAAGSAMALLIENKYPHFNPELSIPYFVTRARLRISYNTFDDFRVRIRFLSVDSITGLPDKDLFEESIISTSGMRKGWLNFNLAKYRIKINVPSFFVVFEWLLEDDERHSLLEQYREFKRQFPKKVTTDTLTVDGEKITYNSWHGYRAGTSFSTASDKISVQHHKTYFRNNSYGTWKRSSSILTATVTLVNY